VRWKASAIICYHNNTLKHHTLSSHISPPASQSAVLGFSCLCRSHPSLKSSDMQTEPRGRLSVLDRGVKMVKTCVAPLWKTAFVRLSCVRTEGKTRQKRWLCLKPTQSWEYFIYFFTVPWCLFTHCVFFFSFHPTPFSSTHNFTQTYFLPPFSLCSLLIPFGSSMCLGDMCALSDER